jgi:hypothetical protein
MHICSDTVCIAPSCGDGFQRGAEQCDGDERIAQNCTDYGYYDSKELYVCTDACNFDTSICTGRCGDGIVTPGFEICDTGKPPVQSCVDFGYGAGPLGCNMCGPNLKDCESFGWQSTLVPAGFIDIHGTSDTNVFAVGSNRRISYFDGAAWAPIDTSTCATPSDNLVAVSVIGDREALVLAAAGTLLHVTASGCSVIPGAPPNAFDMWATSLTNVWVSSTSSGIHRYNGTSWSLSSSPAAFNLWGTGTGLVYARFSGGALYRGDDTNTWTGPITTPLSEITSIWGTGPNDVFIGGVANASGAVARFDGMAWSISFTGVGVAVTTGSPSMVTHGYAIGSAVYATGFRIIAGPNPYSPYFLGMLRAGPTMRNEPWTDLGTPLASDGSIFATPSGRVYVVHSNDQYVATLSTLHWTSKPGTQFQTRLDVMDETLVAHQYGPSGDTNRWTGFAWVLENNAPFLQIDESPSGARYALLEDGSLFYRPTTTWGVPPGNAGPVVNGKRLEALAIGNVWLIQQDGNVGHWTGDALTSTEVGATNMQDIWADSSSNVIVVGDGGASYRFDGGTWTALPTGTTEQLIGIRGTSATDLYAWSTNMLLHFNGTAWTTMQRPTSDTIRSVLGTSSDLFLSAGRLFHFDGTVWSPVDLDTTFAPTDIEAVGNTIYFVDGLGIVHELRRHESW